MSLKLRAYTNYLLILNPFFFFLFFHFSSLYSFPHIFPRIF